MNSAGFHSVKRKIRAHRVKLRISPTSRVGRFVDQLLVQTSFLEIALMLVVLWLLFSAGVYYAEQGTEGTSITSFGRALYWGVAAMSTAGIADTPVSGPAQLIGGVWIVIGSVIFFGTIVASITSYFMRPLQRPVRKIVDTIEYNLEHLEELTMDELDLLKETTDTLIDHVERIKARTRPKPGS